MEKETVEKAEVVYGEVKDNPSIGGNLIVREEVNGERVYSTITGVSNHLKDEIEIYSQPLEDTIDLALDKLYDVTELLTDDAYHQWGNILDAILNAMSADLHQIFNVISRDLGQIKIDRLLGRKGRTFLPFMAVGASLERKEEPAYFDLAPVRDWEERHGA